MPVELVTATGARVTPRGRPSTYVWLRSIDVRPLLREVAGEAEAGVVERVEHQRAVPRKHGKPGGHRIEARNYGLAPACRVRRRIVEPLLKRRHLGRGWAIALTRNAA